MAESSVENAFDQESDEKARERDPQLHVLVQAEPTADESADRIRADKGRGDDQQREPRRRHRGPPGYDVRGGPNLVNPLQIDYCDLSQDRHR